MCDARRGYATAKLCRQALSGICGWLVRRERLASNPVRDLTPLEQRRDKVARAMTPRDVQQWLAIVDGSEFARRWDLPELTRFMLVTGVRPGEALGVRWEDVDLEHATVSIEWTVIRLRGRGLVASRLKTTSSARVLVLPGWCRRMLIARRLRPGASVGPVFPDKLGGFRDRNNVGAAYRKVKEGTRFEWVTPHAYRKTVATLVDSQGASARLIADQLGHSRVSMTQDVYMGRRAVQRDNADVLDRFDPDKPADDDQDPDQGSGVSGPEAGSGT